MRNLSPVLFMLTIQLIPGRISAQQVLPLYDGPVPNSRPSANEESSDTEGGILRIQKVSQPTLAIYLPPPEKATGAAIVICPGGGYKILAADHEGYGVAKKLNEKGIAAFVLKYRIPSDSTMIDKSIGPLQDAQAALEMVRRHAKEWQIDPKRTGIMGFSAGGHLAASAGTNPSMILGKKVKKKAIPDFMILVYPVISFMDSIGHRGSRDNLLGLHPEAEKVRRYSNELQVNKKTPPTFLVHAKDDFGVLVKNSTVFYEKLQQHHISSGIYLYEKGGHGFGLNNSTSDTKWLDTVVEWLNEQGWLKKKK